MKAIGVLSVLAAMVMTSHVAEAQNRPRPGRRGPAPLPRPMPGPMPGHNVEQIVLEMNDLVTTPGRRRGRGPAGTVIGLRREAQLQHGNRGRRGRGRGLDLSNARLIDVVVVAKSAAGFGQASLNVGHQLQDRATVPQGNMRAPGPRSFSRIRLNNFDRLSQGAWQLELNGRIVVRRIILNVRGLDGRGGHARDMLLGTGNATRFGSGLSVFNAHGLQGDVVKITAQSGAINVISATAIMRNGRAVPLSLRGIVRPGETIEAFLPVGRIGPRGRGGAVLSSIEVIATPAGRARGPGRRGPGRRGPGQGGMGSQYQVWLGR